MHVTLLSLMDHLIKRRLCFMTQLGTLTSMNVFIFTLTSILKRSKSTNLQQHFTKITLCEFRTVHTDLNSGAVIIYFIFGECFEFLLMANYLEQHAIMPV